MCLVLAAVRVLDDAPLVLLANRDEWYDRPSEGPRSRGGDPEIVCGLDLRAGGTWLGRNAAGVVAVLTNRPGPQDASRPSRGGIPMTALGARDAADGARRAADLAASLRPNPFSLLVADRRGAWFVSAESDGMPSVRELAPGLRTHTNTHDLDALPADVVLRASGVALPAFTPGMPIDAAVAVLEGVAAGHAPLDGTRAAACVHAGFRGTVSSAILVLAADPSRDVFRHAAGAPCGARFADVGRV